MERYETKTLMMIKEQIVLEPTQEDKCAIREEESEQDKQKKWSAFMWFCKLRRDAVRNTIPLSRVLFHSR